MIFEVKNSLKLLLIFDLSHSRQSVIDKYPDMTSYSLTNLYKAHEPGNLPKFNPNLNTINLTEFSLDTKSDVVHIACVIGENLDGFSLSSIYAISYGPCDMVHIIWSI